ncbi:MAG: DNA polymerase III subunit epsilon [Xanthomonadales bacterium]|jgi:DNA polymerase-3 subunit epsilon|nr:DNA polymerase III subunit epsilon [Xanthomonadales bacterium]MBP6077603.1 DNA polymerase III subunit epsilon [Xanthomonadales bacterium]MBP7622579.1 DNA polymerase III subunit epsilon [Xanthomonadales bacterium]
MRQIILDTETTGLDARSHRVIEIGCVELIERRPSGRVFHRYLNPQREVDRGAAEVHGLTDDFLADKPLFAQVVADFIAFIDGAELIIHNAAFDIGFLDAELSRLGPDAGRIGDRCAVLDTLKLARERYPGQRNSLDALCKRLGVDNSGRDLHGALLDANLLSEVYLALTAGQGEMSFAAPVVAAAVANETLDGLKLGALRVLRASAEELAMHESRLDAIAKSAKKPALWRELQS